MIKKVTVFHSFVSYDNRNIAEAVDKPAELGYYSQAYSALSAFIDNQLYHLMLGAFPGSVSHELIQFLEKDRVLTSRRMAALLNSKSLVDTKFLTGLDEFNRMRGFVVHDAVEEYSLVLKRKDFDQTKISQEKLDAESQELAKKGLEQGKALFRTLLATWKKIYPEMTQ